MTLLRSTNPGKVMPESSKARFLIRTPLMEIKSKRLCFTRQDNLSLSLSLGFPLLGVRRPEIGGLGIPLFSGVVFYGSG
jgi:hypothetical protein